jgi:hypothetical protein
LIELLRAAARPIQRTISEKDQSGNEASIRLIHLTLLLACDRMGSAGPPTAADTL